MLRHDHRAGEKLFVDYAGDTIPVWNPESGEVAFRAAIFVAAMGASNYTFAEATESQELRCWIGSHLRVFDFLGGLPEILVPDNLKTGVKKPCRYEPDLNPTYHVGGHLKTKFSEPGEGNIICAEGAKSSVRSSSNRLKVVS